MVRMVNLPEKALDNYVYRIVPLERLFELFYHKRNVLVDPSLWDDPWENVVLQSRFKVQDEIVDFLDAIQVYGQCWTYHTASDAMWRIYAPDTKGVRIKVSIRNLSKMLIQSIGQTSSYECAIGKVEYLKDSQFRKFREDPFPKDIDTMSALDTLLKKRNAFSHENELRVLYGPAPGKGPKGCFSEDRKLFYCKFDPCEMIEQIMLHPAMDRSMATVVKDAIAKATGFPTEKIKRSLLYAAPSEVIAGLL